MTDLTAHRDPVCRLLARGDRHERIPRPGLHPRRRLAGRLRRDRAATAGAVYVAHRRITEERGETIMFVKGLTPDAAPHRVGMAVSPSHQPRRAHPMTVDPFGPATPDIVFTGPIVGTVTCADSTVYDVTPPAIYVQKKHRQEVADLIGARYVAEGHPQVEGQFIHEQVRE